MHRNKWVALLLFFCFELSSVLFQPLYAQSNKQLSDCLSSADNLIRQNRLDAAEKKLEECIKLGVSAKEISKRKVQIAEKRKKSINPKPGATPKASGETAQEIARLKEENLRLQKQLQEKKSASARGNSEAGKEVNENETVKDIDGNTYKTVKIGEQVWMAENLKVTRYRNGEAIPTILSDDAWKNTSNGAYAIYDNEAAANKTYGKLYNWYAVKDSRGLCPEGWHVPMDAEWTQLENFLEGEDIAGGKMKAVSHLWKLPNQGATNASGFLGLPGGIRDDDGSYDAIGYYGYWWSSSEYSSSDAEYRLLYYSNGYSRWRFSTKSCGFSVRCLRD